jgi:HAE1 family hydrophobic/amphiphilic exporter-1
VTINIMTLGGLAVAVGRVVDDAIVVLENIYRHRALGEDRRTASINGPREVAGAITASTLTTVAVFLPLGFVGGLVSQFFLPFALTVTFALLASLVCALTVVPVLA